MEKILYFAYGSNLNIREMKKRCPGAAGISPAVLEGYKLVERTHADIEPAENFDDCVHGALYRITPEDLASLDSYEGYPQYYTREEVMVIDNAGVYHQAWTYMMTEEYSGEQNQGSFSERYREICSEGADYWKIPNAFIQQEMSPSTLWNGDIPEVSAGIEQMLNCLDSCSPLPRAKRLWNGARVVITLTPQNIRGDFDFYPAPLEVTTKHALELTWVFNDLRDLFVRGGLLNDCNKFDFYHALAQAASDALAQVPEITARNLCRTVIEQAQKIYQEMK